MKTLTGKVVSSTPISVSKAAKIIANFAATDNGASQAISAYLRRASASFNELKQFHRELRKGSKSDRKHKRSKSEVTVEGAGESSFEPSVFNLTRGAVELSQEASHGDGDSERNKHKNKKKEKEKGGMGNLGDGGGKIVIEDGDSKRIRKQKKNEGNFEEDEGKMVIEQSEGKKHKKMDKSGKKIETLKENGVSIEKGEMGNEEKREGEEKKKKKRKSGDIEGTENNSSSAPRKKKKKIKNEVDK